jgi:serine/threonine protein kinase
MEGKKEDEKQEVKTNEIINEEKNEQNNNQINIVNNNNINNKTESENFIDKTILNKYKLIKKIRRGSQAQIYLGENIKTFEQYAIKIEKNKSENCLLKNEIYMLGNLQNNSQKNMGIVEMITCAKYKII